MKKIYTVIIIFIFGILLFFSYKKQDLPKIIKVKSADEFYIDFNKNNFPDETELVSLYYIRAFKPQKNKLCSQIDSAKLSYLADRYANIELLNKHAEIKYDEKHRLITVLVDGNDYSKMLMEHGYAIPNDGIKNNVYSKYLNETKIKSNLKLAENLKIVSYNIISKKYHNLDCPFALTGNNFILLEQNNVHKSAKKCKLCIIKPEKTKKVKEKYPRIVYEEYKPLFVNNFIELYSTDFTKYYFTTNQCNTTVCKSLLNNINKSQYSIDFAVYGIYNEPVIINALKNAQNRGVKIRWVYDIDSQGNSIYSDTKKSAQIFKNSKSDVNNKYARSIMHNKFFIFDNKSVWMGSANISDTDLSGFNANTVLLIKSPVIAQIYTNEFEQMYSEKFHKDKLPTTNNENIKLGNATISVYFSPQDKALTNKITKLIQNAKTYIYIPVFIITEKNFIQELKNAKSRGVDVKIITDATGASNKYSPVKDMRKNGLKIKVENRAGKMHSKAIVIDDEYLITGSMNYSKSAEHYNDENVVIIKDKQIAKTYKNHFLYLWNKIPDKWLYQIPAAESFNSINSCFDGIDNDYDGKIDSADEGCFYNKKARKKSAS